MRQFLGCYFVGTDRLTGRMVKRKGTKATLDALKRVRAAFPDGEPVFRPLWTNLNHHKSRVVLEWAAVNAVELCFTPTYASWANPIECHFGAIRHFVLTNCTYPNHHALAARLHAHLRRWRNCNARDPELVKVLRAEQRRLRSERAKSVSENRAKVNGRGTSVLSQNKLAFQMGVA